MVFLDRLSDTTDVWGTLVDEVNGVPLFSRGTGSSKIYPDANVTLFVPLTFVASATIALLSATCTLPTPPTGRAPGLMCPLPQDGRK
jgi:hypothetical protein